MDCVVNPPQPGEPSYEQFGREKAEVLESLSKRAKSIAETFNSIPGMNCNIVQGAMYAFPQVNYLITNTSNNKLFSISSIYFCNLSINIQNRTCTKLGIQ